MALILLTGIGLPAVLGVVIRLVLQARGMEVVTWGEGARWMLPLTLLFLPPYLLLTLVAYRSLLRRVTLGGRGLRSWWHVFLGAYLGLATVDAYLLILSLQNIRDTAHLVAFWPVTLPMILLWSLGGAACGTLGGWALWRLRR